MPYAGRQDDDSTRSESRPRSSFHPQSRPSAGVGRRGQAADAHKRQQEALRHRAEVRVEGDGDGRFFFPEKLPLPL
jgi:hypothetical protein